jgi:predicted transcriptional regulator
MEEIFAGLDAGDPLATRRAKARTLRLLNFSLTEIAAALGVSTATISRDVKDLPRQRIVRDGYKFSDKEVLAMRKLVIDGMPQVGIAKLYEASEQTVSQFAQGKRRAKGRVSKPRTPRSDKNKPRTTR